MRGVESGIHPVLCVRIRQSKSTSHAACKAKAQHTQHAKQKRSTRSTKSKSTAHAARKAKAQHTQHAKQKHITRSTQSKSTAHAACKAKAQHTQQAKQKHSTRSTQSKSTAHAARKAKAQHTHFLERMAATQTDPRTRPVQCECVNEQVQQAKPTHKRCSRLFRCNLFGAWLHGKGGGRCEGSRCS